MSTKYDRWFQMPMKCMIIFVVGESAIWHLASSKLLIALDEEMSISVMILKYLKQIINSYFQNIIKVNERQLHEYDFDLDVIDI